MPPENPASTAVFIAHLNLGGEGPSVGIKDSIDIAGHPTRAASAALADRPPAVAHAQVVRELLAAGCRIVAKTNLHELAYGVTGINDWTGTPVNPAMPDRVPGGSSSGSAVAVAAGLVDFSIGTDTGGSIRIPAACCGVLGLKPSFGRISREGVTPTLSSLDCVGPFARDITQLELACRSIDPAWRPVATPGTVRLRTVSVTANPAISAALAAALARPGIAATAVALPSLEDAYDAALTIISAENWKSYAYLVDHPGLGPDVRARLRKSQAVTPAQVAAAEAVRGRFRQEVDAALEGVDALVLPTLPDLPPTLESGRDSTASLALTRFVRPFNLSGHPALTLPIPLTDGRPTGLQLVGRQGSDEALCAVARALSHCR